MSRIIIITNPADDKPTEYLDSWSQGIINTARKQKDTLVFELNGKKVNRKELTKIIKDKKPQLVVFNGHGTSEAIFGFHAEILVQCNDNEHILKNSLVHSMSCNSGERLGPRTIKIGAVCYIGYAEQFKFVHMGKKTKGGQLRDSVAGLFLKPAYQAIISLIKGKSAKEAYRDSQKLYVDNLKKCLASTSTDLNTAVASRLYHDFKYQVCLGNQDASF